MPAYAGHGGHCDLVPLSGRASLEDSVAEDTTGAADGGCVPYRGLAACAARHLEDSRDAHLGAVDHRSQLRAVLRALLGLRCAQAHALGVARATRPLQHAA